MCPRWILENAWVTAYLRWGLDGFPEVMRNRLITATFTNAAFDLEFSRLIWDVSAGFVQMRIQPAVNEFGADLYGMATESSVPSTDLSHDAEVLQLLEKCLLEITGMDASYSAAGSVG